MGVVSGAFEREFGRFVGVRSLSLCIMRTAHNVSERVDPACSLKRVTAMRKLSPRCSIGCKHADVLFIRLGLYYSYTVRVLRRLQAFTPSPFEVDGGVPLALPL